MAFVMTSALRASFFYSMTVGWGATSCTLTYMVETTDYEFERRVGCGFDGGWMEDEALSYNVSYESVTLYPNNPAYGRSDETAISGSLVDSGPCLYRAITTTYSLIDIEYTYSAPELAPDYDSGSPRLENWQQCFGIYCGFASRNLEDNSPHIIVDGRINRDLISDGIDGIYVVFKNAQGQMVGTPRFVGTSGYVTAWFPSGQGGFFYDVNYLFGGSEGSSILEFSIKFYPGPAEISQSETIDIYVVYQNNSYLCLTESLWWPGSP